VVVDKVTLLVDSHSTDRLAVTRVVDTQISYVKA
jgi:hypothetical protein